LKVLLICHRRPDPQGPGDAKIGHQVLVALERRGHSVCVAAPSGARRDRNVSGALIGALRGMPLQIGLTSDPELAAAVTKLITQHAFDLGIAVHARAVMQLPEELRPRSLALIIDAYGRSYATYAPFVPIPSRMLYAFEAKRMRRFERWIAEHHARTCVVSRVDRDHLIAEGCSEDRVVHLPYAVDLDYFGATSHAPFGGSPLFAMIGRLNYVPNQDAARQFITRIAPLLRVRWPAARVVLAGADPPHQLRTLALRSGVEMRANLLDVRDMLASATAVMVPMRIGGGVQTKILEAMAARVPVVCTSFANQGVAAQPERDLLIANDGGEFVAAADRIINDFRLAQSLSARGRVFVENHHSKRLFEARLLSNCEEVAGGR